MVRLLRLGRRGSRFEPGLPYLTNGNIAQWLEQHPYTVPVKGSSPFISTKKVSCPSGKGVLCKRIMHKFESCTDLIVFLWCNGSTSDFGSEDRGSSPCGKTDGFRSLLAIGLVYLYTAIAGRARCVLVKIFLYLNLFYLPKKEKPGSEDFQDFGNYMNYA
jgi:hypothetical protein